MIRGALWIAPLLATASCAAHVERCTPNASTFHASSEPPWVREEAVDHCIVSPDLRARWSIECGAETCVLSHADVDAASWRLSLLGFQFLLARRVDGGVIVVEWISNETFAGVRIDVVDANGKVERVVDEADDGSEWRPAGLSVGWDGSFFVARWLRGGEASRLTAYAPNGDRRWRLVEPGMAHAPLVDRQGRSYLASESHHPPSGSIHAITPQGETLWRHDLPFNRAALALGVRPDGDFVFEEAMIVAHVPADDDGVRLYLPYEGPRLCTLSRKDGVLACEAQTPTFPETIPLGEDGAHRIP